MKTAVFEKLPDDAKAIRVAVFMNEQGFKEEFDETDNDAVHLVLYSEDETPIATCRLFPNKEMNAYTLGRLAVIKEYRGKGIGSVMVGEAEKYIKSKGGKGIVLHAQCRAVQFYTKSGFTEFGEIGDEEGCPHIWMKKEF